MKKLLVLGFIAAIIALMAQYPHAMLNPGELIQGHQLLNGKCLSCHTSFKGVSSEKCIACHKLADIGMDTLTGKVKGTVLFHQKLGDYTCTHCHTDHAGRTQDAPLTKFSHSLLPGADLNNCNSCHNKPSDKLHNQVSTSCINCHTTNQWALSGPFDHSMLQPGTIDNCSACHSKPADELHASADNNCLSCHTTSKWSPATFEHSKYFYLDANHNTKCAVCHTRNDFSRYTCYGCHEHTPANILREHAKEGIANNLDQCVRCHKSGSEHEGEGGKTHREGHDDNKEHEEDD